MTISFRLKEDTSWAKKGHEVAFGQGVIAAVRSIPSKKVTPFTVTHGTHTVSYTHLDVYKRQLCSSPFVVRGSGKFYFPGVFLQFLLPPVRI